MLKTKNVFLDHFARLGVFSKVQALMDDDAESESSVIKTPTDTESAAQSTSAQSATLPSPDDSSKCELTPSHMNASCDCVPYSLIFVTISRACIVLDDSTSDDAKELLQGKAYNWHDWSLCRGRDCLYVWSDSAALELSNGSNGWFRFIIDGKLATMYSSGSPENGNDNSGIFLNIIHRTYPLAVNCASIACAPINIHLLLYVLYGSHVVRLYQLISSRI